MNALPARRVPHRVGRRSLRHLVERRAPQRGLGTPEHHSERSRLLAVRALGTLYA